MKLLVTGGCGFIGSNLIHYWLKHHPDDTVINLDALTYAANLGHLKSVESDPRYTFIKADIADREQVAHVLKKYKPEGVIHLAAESHVDNSILGPETFIKTNVLGTFHLLEECRQAWGSARHRFHHVSTDEVYGSLGLTGAFTESTAYHPRSPYSASKAGSDHLVMAYHHTYGMNVTLTQCSNNFGPRQHPEKLIPTVIRTALAGKPIPVYGQGTNVRDWLSVEDHCHALDLVFHRAAPGSRYNVGGHHEIKNIDLVRMICHELDEQIGKGPGGKYQELIQFVTDRPGHDFRYAIDHSKITAELGWKPSTEFSAALRATVRYFVKEFS